MNRFIIDGFNLMYRSHHAFQRLSTSTDLSSGSIYGFLTTMRTLRKRFTDFNFFIAWDNIPTKKTNIFPEYKANRISQRNIFPLEDLKKALSCLNVTQVECPEEEADDVISTLINQPNDSGKDYIYTSDKDMLQLVQDGRVIVMSPKVGNTPEKFYDEEAVKAKWGVSPSDLSCYLALRGDVSDNVPGVERLPSKVIASLINKYKTPEGIYSGLANEKLTDFQRTKLAAARDQVLLNYTLVLLKPDLNCSFSFGKSNSEIFQYILDKYEIKAISSESYVDLFDSDTVFLHRNSPSLKSVSLF